MAWNDNRKDLKWVRSIYGKGDNAREKYHHIVDGGMNEVIREWHKKQPEREIDIASPSKITDCPLKVWLKVKGVPITNPITWGVQQRFLLGRLFEDTFATQLKEAKLPKYKLHKHWEDNPKSKKNPLVSGVGLNKLQGTPDYLLEIDKVVYVSDAKTSRSDSFGYVEIEYPEIFNDGGWDKYRIQLNAYFLLLLNNAEWLGKNKLPLPSGCHLFSYSLDDGIVRREITWTPSAKELSEVEELTVRYNSAILSELPPKCTCTEWQMKFCDYAIIPEGSKVGESCCDEDLINKVKE